MYNFLIDFWFMKKAFFSIFWCIIFQMRVLRINHCGNLEGGEGAETKTFTEHWDSKRHLLELSWLRPKIYIFWNKTFQDRKLKLSPSVWKKSFMKPHKISIHSAHSDNYYFRFFYWLSDSFSNRCWKSQLSILKKKFYS